jgi:rRNA processing protein Gar1
MIELGIFTHSCEDMLVCKATCENAPLIKRQVFFQNKSKIGIVDDVFGPINAYVIF